MIASCHGLFSVTWVLLENIIFVTPATSLSPVGHLVPPLAWCLATFSTVCSLLQRLFFLFSCVIAVQGYCSYQYCLIFSISALSCVVSSLLLAYKLHRWFFMVSCTLNWVIAFINMWSGCNREIWQLVIPGVCGLSCLALIHLIRSTLSVFSKSMSYHINILYWYSITYVNILPKGLALRHFFPSTFFFFYFCFFLCCFLSSQI